MNYDNDAPELRGAQGSRHRQLRPSSPSSSTCLMTRWSRGSVKAMCCSSNLGRTRLQGKWCSRAMGAGRTMSASSKRNLAANLRLRHSTQHTGHFGRGAPMS